MNEWDAFIEQVKTMGDIDKVIEIYNNATQFKRDSERLVFGTNKVKKVKQVRYIGDLGAFLLLKNAPKCYVNAMYQ